MRAAANIRQNLAQYSAVPGPAAARLHHPQFICWEPEARTTSAEP